MNQTAFLINLTKDCLKTNASCQKYFNIRAIRSWDFWDVSLLTLFIIGTIGNTTTIFIMRSKYMKYTNTSFFLTCLAVADMNLLFIKLISNIIKIYALPIHKLCILFSFILPELCAYMSYWLMIVTTLERLIAVLLPFSVQQIFSRKRCLFLIFLLLMFFLCLTGTQASCLTDDPTRPQFCLIRGQPTGQCFYYMKYVYPLFKAAFMCWLPGLLGLVFNTTIIVELYKASKSRRFKMTLEEFKIRSKERQITVMLTAVSVIFILTTLPYATFEILRRVSSNIKFRNRNLHRAQLLAIDTLHATNFILYCMLGKRFRVAVKQLICPNYSHHHGHNGLYSNSLNKSSKQRLSITSLISGNNCIRRVQSTQMTILVTDVKNDRVSATPKELDAFL